MSDEEFLRALHITPAPDIQSNYDKSKKELEDMLNAMITPAENDTDLTASPYFEQADGYSELDPESFIIDDDYKTQVTSDLIISVQQYLSFATSDDLYNLIENLL